MRLFRFVSWVLIPLLWLGASPTAQAQLSREECEKRIAVAIALLEHGNEDEQQVAIAHLGQFARPLGALPPERGLPLFRAHLQRHTKTLTEALTVKYAVQALAQYGTGARPALPDLIRLLDEAGTVQGEATNSREIWYWLPNALSEIGPGDPEVIAVMKRALKRCTDRPDRLSSLVFDTVRALPNMGRSAHTLVPILTLTLGRVPVATYYVATALSHMMPEAVLSVPTLIRILEEGRAQKAIIEALGTMGNAAKSAIPALHRVRTLSSPELACKAFAAIAQIEGHSALTLPVALETLHEIDQHSLAGLYTALMVLTREGKNATETVPLLTQIVQTRKEPWLRRTAIEALADIGPAENREAALVLLQAAHRQDPAIALDVDTVFNHMGTGANQVIPELNDLMMSDTNIRDRALGALTTAGPRAVSVVPNLLRLLREGAHGDLNHIDVAAILRLLITIGPASSESILFLTELILQADNAHPRAIAYPRTCLLSTLMQIGITPRVLPAVREMLQSSNPADIACAAHTVALLGRQAADTIPLLLLPLRPGFRDRAMTSDFSLGYVEQTTARNECMRALASFGKEAKEALPLLQTYADLPLPSARSPFNGPPSLQSEARRAIQAILSSK